MIKEFTIDRSIWLRGGQGNGSYLLRECDGKRCCLGIYLEACGVPDELMRGFAAPGMLYRDHPEVRQFVPKWLIGPPWHSLSTDPNVAVNSPEAQGLMEINDDNSTSDQERETFIAEQFAKHGVEVHFV